MADALFSTKFLYEQTIVCKRLTVAERQVYNISRNAFFTAIFTQRIAAEEGQCTGSERGFIPT